MNEFCAAMGICNLKYIESEIEKRKQVAEHYRERLETAEGIYLNAVQDNVRSNYAYFPVVIEEKIFGAGREKIIEKLKANNINARKYFYPLTSAFSCFHGQFDVFKTPVALHISKHILTLPLYAELSLREVNRICNLILACRG